MLIPLCSVISSWSMSISTEERCGAAILVAVEIGNIGEGWDEDRQVLIVSCIVRVASLRR